MSLANTNIHQRGEIPEITKLPNNRIRVVRRFQKFTREDVDNANLGSLMGNFGDLDTTGEQITNQGYTDCRLISVEVDTRFNQQANADNAVLVKTYETLTSSFVQIVDDTVEYTENGLKKVTRVYRAVSGTTSSNTVGTTAISGSEPTIILASSEIEDNDAFAQLTEVYLESGNISIDKSSGPQGLPNTYTRTYTSRLTEPTSSGIALSREVNNVNGYEQYVYTFLEGSTEGSTPLGTDGQIISYEKIIEVRQAGVVSGSSVSVTDGNIAVLNTVPPSIKKIKADVTISLVTSNALSDPSTFAYNLSDTSVSAAITTTRVSPIGVEQGSSLTVSVFNSSSSSDTRTFPNYYRSNGGASGTITSAAQIIRDEDNIIGEALNSSTSTSIVLTGSTSAPPTTGTYQENLDPAFLDADGTQYYRKTVYSIS